MSPDSHGCVFQSPQPDWVQGAVLDGGKIPVRSEPRCCKRKGTWMAWDWEIWNLGG